MRDTPDFDSLPLRIGFFSRAVVALIVWVAERLRI